MKKVSIAISNFQTNFGNERALEIAKEIGADAVDFGIYSKDYDFRNDKSIYARSDDEIYSYFDGLYRKAQSLGIEIGMTHGRISTFKNIPENDAAVLENARRDCLATSALRAPYCVMHGVTTCNFSPDVQSEFMHDLNYSYFSQALEYAHTYGIKIATETFGDAPNFGCCDFFGNTSEFKTFYDRVIRECKYADSLVMCMDTGHINKAMRFNGNPTPADSIRILGGNIKCLHLNDNDGMTDQHKMPMTGNIDWEDVFAALDEIGYNGIYNMELSLKRLGVGFEIEYAEFALKHLKHLLKCRYGE